MHYYSLTTAVVLCCLSLFAMSCGNKSAETLERSSEDKVVDSKNVRQSILSSEPVFDTADQRASYGIGYNVGSSILSDGKVEIDMNAMVAGLTDSLGRISPRLGPKVLQEAMEELQKRSEIMAETIGGDNLTKSLKFLEGNSKREGISVTPSGLQYEILKSSSGPDTPKPTITEKVEVHYHGTLTDGSVFDSSVQRGEPITFAVAGVIPGWTEALQLMSVGDKWKLYLPPAIAYGSRQTGSIPANSALIFEVELIRILESKEGTSP